MIFLARNGESKAKKLCEKKDAQKEIYVALVHDQCKWVVHDHAFFEVIVHSDNDLNGALRGQGNLARLGPLVGMEHPCPGVLPKLGYSGACGLLRQFAPVG